MNWGHKILFVYLAFVAGILFIVFKVSGEKDDLVTPDYYAQELKYQQRIDQTKRADALSAELQFVLKENQLQISFPKDFAGKLIKGNVLLYCPSDENRDIRKDFSVTDTSYTLSIPPGYKGAYELHVNWQVDGLDYYSEKKIVF
ncbi:MAG: FixH family protein [Sphingobacteriales bacterium]|nr:FixH family protein [Sphingobacteriales bacterium]